MMDSGRVGIDIPSSRYTPKRVVDSAMPNALAQGPRGMAKTTAWHQVWYARPCICTRAQWYQKSMA